MQATDTTGVRVRSWLLDMEGVPAHEERAIPGADRFLARLRELQPPYLVLTNNSIYTPRDMVDELESPLSSAVAGA